MATAESEKMQSICWRESRKAQQAYLNRQYRAIGLVGIVVAILVFIFSIAYAAAFRFIDHSASCLVPYYPVFAGYIGMKSFSVSRQMSAAAQGAKREFCQTGLNRCVPGAGAVNRYGWVRLPRAPRDFDLLLGVDARQMGFACQ